MQVHEITGLSKTEAPDGEAMLSWRAMGQDFEIWLTASGKVKPTLFRYSSHGIDRIKNIEGDHARMLAKVMNMARDRGLLKAQAEQHEEDGAAQKSVT